MANESEQLLLELAEELESRAEREPLDISLESAVALLVTATSIRRVLNRREAARKKEENEQPFRAADG
jgi:hypothetical protein